MIDWDWKEFFNKVEDIELLKAAVQNREDYIDSKVRVIFFIDDDTPTDLIYSPWSEKYFRLSFDGNKTSIDKKYLMFFIEDAIKERSFYKKHTDKSSFEYVTYDFLFNMHMAKETSSGTTAYKNHLEQLVSLVQEKSISIQGSELIFSIQQLEQYLKQEFHGFTSLDLELS